MRSSPALRASAAPADHRTPTAFGLADEVDVAFACPGSRRRRRTSLRRSGLSEPIFRIPEAARVREDPGRSGRRCRLRRLERERARFLAQLVADALAPSNFLLGNPSALRKARATRGWSVLRGLRHFARDLVWNGGMPSQVDTSAFRVGGNIATTDGRGGAPRPDLEMTVPAAAPRRLSERLPVSDCPCAIPREQREWGIGDYAGAIERGAGGDVRDPRSRGSPHGGACAGA